MSGVGPGRSPGSQQDHDDHDPAAGRADQFSVAGDQVAGRLVVGTRWMTVGQVGTQVLRFSVNIVLARLLSPRDFGLVAMALVVVFLLDIVRAMGLRLAVVQRKELQDRTLDVVFTLNLFLGAAATVALVALAPLVAGAFGRPALTPLLQVLALMLLLGAPGEIHNGLLRRAMRFRAVAAVTLTGAMVTVAVSVTAAALGAGAWSLVLGYVVGAAAQSATAWACTQYRPRLLWQPRELRGVWAFSLNATLSAVIGFLLLNVDQVVVGRVLGATALGYYVLVQRLALYPMTITLIIGETLVASFSRWQDDHASIRRVYLRAAGGIAMICWPILVGAAVVASPLVEVVLGEAWRPSATLMHILAPAAAVQCVALTQPALYTATGRTDLLLRWSVASGVVMAGSYTIGVQWGLVGVAWAYAAAVVVLAVPGFLIPFRLVGLQLGQLVTAVAPYLVATLTMAGVVMAVMALAGAADVGDLGTLVAATLTGAATYVSLLVVLRPPGVSDLLRLLGRSTALTSRRSSAATSSRWPS